MSRSTVARSHSLLAALSFVLALALAGTAWAQPPGGPPGPPEPPQKGAKGSIDLYNLCEFVPDDPYTIEPDPMLNVMTSWADSDDPADTPAVVTKIEWQVQQQLNGWKDVGDSHTVMGDGISSPQSPSPPLNLCNLLGGAAVDELATAVRVEVTVTIYGRRKSVVGRCDNPFTDVNPVDGVDDADESAIDVAGLINCDAGTTATSTDTTTDPTTTTTTGL